METKYSISETARLLSIHRSTLHRWIDSGVVPKPIEEDTAGMRLRYWLREGFAMVKKHKEEHFREGQGQRKGRKTKRS
jgi:predicted site-specific integrase-resolvase